LPEKHSA